MSSHTKQTKLININGDLSDPFYRYKMPEVIIRNQGAFNAFLNINDICDEKKGINRPINDIQKFLNKNLHTSFSYKNNCLITSAPITKEQIQNIIFQYINKFVLCSKCLSPETSVIKDKKKDFNKCRACGNSDELTIDGIIKPIKKKENKIKDVQEFVNENNTIVNEHYKIVNEHNKIILNNDLDKKDDKIIPNNDLDKKIIIPKEIDQELEDMIDNI